MNLFNLTMVQCSGNCIWFVKVIRFNLIFNIFSQINGFFKMLKVHFSNFNIVINYIFFDLDIFFHLLVHPFKIIFISGVVKILTPITDKAVPKLFHLQVDVVTESLSFLKSLFTCFDPKNLVSLSHKFLNSRHTKIFTVFGNIKSSWNMIFIGRFNNFFI